MESMTCVCYGGLPGRVLSPVADRGYGSATSGRTGMRRRVPALWLFSGSVVLALAGAAAAQTPAPLPPAIAEPQDRPYPGVVRLAVDASDVGRHIFRIRETIPVESGALTLLYPKW